MILRAQPVGTEFTSKVNIENIDRQRGPDRLPTVESQGKVIISIWRCERVSRCSFARSVDSSDPPPPGQKQRRSLLCLTCLCMLLLCSRPWTVRLKERQRCASARRPSASSSCPRWQPATVPSASAAAACSSSPTCSSLVSPRMWTHRPRVGVLPQQQQQYFFFFSQLWSRDSLYMASVVKSPTILDSKLQCDPCLSSGVIQIFLTSAVMSQVEIVRKKTTTPKQFHIWCHNMSTVSQVEQLFM